MLFGRSNGAKLLFGQKFSVSMIFKFIPVRYACERLLLRHPISEDL